MNAAPTILKRITTLSVVAAVAATAGLFVPGDTMATGSFTSRGLDLKIDSKAWYNGASVPGSTWSLKNLVPGADKFFNFGDIKPGDFGKTVVSMHPSRSSAWLCLDFTNFTNKDNTQNEPEAAVDPNGLTTGELGTGMEFFGWLDSNGDGVFQPPSEKPLFGTTTQSALTTINNRSYAVADASHGPACRDGGTKYVGIAWCAGDLGVNLSTGVFSCNGGTLGNAAQTDSISVDVSIRALPSSQDAKFTCGKGSNGGGHEGDDDHKGDQRGDGHDDDWHEVRNGKTS